MDGTCSGCGKAVAGGDVMYTPDARVVCPACYAKADLKATELRGGGFGIAGVGAIAGAIPFFVKMYTVTNGTYRDWIAVGGGAVAVICGAIAIIGGLKGRRPMLVAGVGVIALGGYQIATGLGAFYKPEPAVTITREPPVVAPPVANPDDPQTCEGKKSCFDLGMKLDKAKDAKGALVAYQRACDAGAAGGCYNVGFSYEHGETGAKDMAKAVAAYTRACDLGAPDGCTFLGESKLMGEPADIAGALPLLEKGCDGNNPSACNNLGVIARDGMNGAADPAKALALFDKSCGLEETGNNSFASGCNNGGSLYAQGKGTKLDGKAARERFEKACAVKPELCFNLGIANEEGLGGAKDLATARQLYGKACDAEEGSACQNLSLMLKNGEGGPKDADRAKALHARACELEKRFCK